jgi:NADPH:quinone reductase-like Zn-dependent oxidoreductase
VVIDAVGRSSFAKCRRLLRPRGSYLSSELGPWALNLILVAVTTVIGRRRVRFGVPPTYDQALVDDVRRLLGTGAFRPVIDRTFTLDEIVDAYRYVESGQKIGNVLIQIDANL